MAVNMHHQNSSIVGVYGDRIFCSGPSAVGVLPSRPLKTMRVSILSVYILDRPTYNRGVIQLCLYPKISPEWTV